MKSDGVCSGPDPFRRRSTTLLIVGVGLLAVVLKRYQVAEGIVLGGLLYAVNLLLILEMGRSLLRSGGSRNRAKPLAALGSAGRLLFLAIAMSVIAIFLGREVVLGACGGFLIAQVNLHVPKIGHKREAR
jgi:hypothetical protein